MSEQKVLLPLRRAAVAFLLGCALGAVAQERGRLLGVHAGGDAGASSVQLIGDRPLSFTTLKLRGPPRVVVDFADTELAGIPRELAVDDGTVRRVAAALAGQRTARVVIELAGDAEFSVRAQGNTVEVRVPRIAPLVAEAREPAAPAATAAQVPAADAAPAPAPVEPQAATQPVSVPAGPQDSASSEAARKEPAATAPAQTIAARPETVAPRPETAPAQADRAPAAEAARPELPTVALVGSHPARAAAPPESAARKKGEREARVAEYAEAQRAAAEKSAAARKARLLATADQAAAERHAKALAAEKAAAAKKARVAAAADKAAAEKRAKAVAAEDAAAAKKARAAAVAERAAAQREAAAVAAERAAAARRARAAERAAAARRARAAAAAAKAAAHERAQELAAARAAAAKKARAVAAAENAAAAAERRRARSAPRHDRKLAMAEPPRHTITGIGFRPIGAGEVIVHSDRPLEYGVTGDGDAILLHLPAAAIPLANNRRPLDTRFFNGPVQRIVPLTVEGGTDVRIELKGHAEYQLAQSGGVLTVTFSSSR